MRTCLLHVCRLKPSRGGPPLRVLLVVAHTCGWPQLQQVSAHWVLLCCDVQVLSNAGQANAATGDQGYEDAVNCATLAAASLGVSPDDVLLMSTGAQQQNCCRTSSGHIFSLTDGSSYCVQQVHLVALCISTGTITPERTGCLQLGLHICLRCSCGSAINKETSKSALSAISSDRACCFTCWRAGVIGRRMKMDAFVPAIPELAKSLGASKDDAHRAAVAITTTDLFSKEAALQVGIGFEFRTSAHIHLQCCKNLCNAGCCHCAALRHV